MLAALKDLSFACLNSQGHSHLFTILFGLSAMISLQILGKSRESGPNMDLSKGHATGLYGVETLRDRNVYETKCPV
ncbi:hypothetical protein DPMN_159963 [Dreissena polymorpha]|nr:hypothetical protein DPMN_159963 [Dreissena polymorpha]